jgi:hypothetical protein
MIPIWIILNSNNARLRKSNYMLVKSKITLQNLKLEALLNFGIVSDEADANES